MEEKKLTPVKRFMEAANCNTQRQLAAFLGIQQPCVAHALKKAVLPSNWLLTLLRKNKVNPEWVLYGDGYPKFLKASDSADSLDEEFTDEDTRSMAKAMDSLLADMSRTGRI